MKIIIIVFVLHEENFLREGGWQHEHRKVPKKFEILKALKNANQEDYIFISDLR